MFYKKKNCYNQRFEYSPLVNELKKQTDIAKKQYQGLNNVHRFNRDFDEVMKKNNIIKKI